MQPDGNNRYNDILNSVNLARERALSPIHPGPDGTYMEYFCHKGATDQWKITTQFPNQSAEAHSFQIRVVDANPASLNCDVLSRVIRAPDEE